MAEEPCDAASPDTYTKQPPQPKEKKAGQLEKWQVDQFFEKGYVLVPNFFTPEELEPVKNAILESYIVDSQRSQQIICGWEN